MKFARNLRRLDMKFNKYRFDEITVNYDKKRIPLSAMERTKHQGKYRYFGAQGVIDYVDDYIFDGKYLLIAEDGENLKSKKQNIAQLVNGKFWVNNHAHIVRCNEKCILEYLAYLINSKDISGYITGSAQPKLSQANLNAMEFNIPPVEVQQDILSILLPIEQKIEMNVEINNNLERQAQTLFKAWFVDFETNSGTMPSNWKTASLSSIARISTEVFSPSKNPNVEVEHYSIPALDENRYPVFEKSDRIKSNKYRLTHNSVMISKLNPDTKRIWRPYCISNTPICSTEFIVYEPVKTSYRDFVYSIIDSEKFFNFLCAHTTGSTNSRQRVTPSITLNYDAVLPDDETICMFSSIVSPMYETIENNIKENQLLAETRDKLLPKLMSGELDVSNIDL